MRALRVGVWAKHLGFGVVEAKSLLSGSCYYNNRFIANTYSCVRESRRTFAFKSSITNMSDSQTTESLSNLSISGGDATSTTEEQGKAGKKDAKKDKKAERLAAKLAAAEKAAQRTTTSIENGGLDGPDGTVGDLVMVQSTFKDDRKWSEIRSLNETDIGSNVWIRGRLHVVRGKGKTAFGVLRRGIDTIQFVVSDGVHGMTKESVKWISKVSSESIIDVHAEVVKAETPVQSTTQKNLELHAKRAFVVSLSSSTLPFQLEDASRPEPAADAGSDAVNISVGQDNRLDNRWIDLRTPTSHSIFRIESRVCQFYRQYFLDRDFIEIHTPKLTPGVSEGGAAVFRLKYFETDACLAQSPQLYKQMAISSDFFNVFEIGPVFRAENSMTHRHMCEFTGMDFEMEIKQHYHEVLKVLGDLFVYIFDKLNETCKAELEQVRAQFPFEPLQYRKETLVLSFPDAVALLRGAGVTIGDFEDFSTPQEKLLGKLVKEKYQTDFYIVDRYPLAARPFYTMPCSDDPQYTNSYDVFVRGEEITSGAQRVHDVELLKRRALECGIPLSNISAYLESFKYGAWPHGGAGIGLERVVMLFLGLDNIRKSALFPRTPNRLTP